MNRLLLTACLAGLWCCATSAHAQVYGGFGGASIPTYRSPANRAFLSPYLNLARGNDATINAAIDYHLGTVPEFVRRANQSIFSSQIRGLEVRQRELINVASGAD